MNSVERQALTLCSLGAAGTVTGSKHLLEAGGRRIMLDCGLFQGVRNLRELNWTPLAVEASSIDAVIVTHAHLDHTGYLPRLVREGFSGPIVSTEATAAVAAIILRDSAFLQERDAAFLNKHKATKHHPALPLYDGEDAQQAIDRFTTRPFGREFPLPAWGPDGDQRQRSARHLPPRPPAVAGGLRGHVRHVGHWDQRVPFFVPVADEAGLWRAPQSFMAHPCNRGLRLRG